MLRTVPELIAELRKHRADLAALTERLEDEGDDIAEITDALDDAIAFLIERTRTRNTPNI